MEPTCVAVGGVGWAGLAANWFLQRIGDWAADKGLDGVARMSLRLRPGPKLLMGFDRINVPYRFLSQIAESQQVCAAWYSGRGVLRERGDITQHGRKFRLILPEPQGPNIEAFGALDGVDFAGDIRRGLRIAERLNMDVRIFPGGFWGVEFTIGDPESKNGWAHLGLHIPALPVESRPYVRITRKGAKKEFDALVTAFEDMWKKATPPSSAVRALPVELYVDEDGYLSSTPSRRSIPDTAARSSPTPEGERPET